MGDIDKVEHEGLKFMHAEALRRESELAARIAELERRTAEVTGLSPGPVYMLSDVDAIEAARGKPYARLRATVERVVELERELHLSRAATATAEACLHSTERDLDAATERAEKAEAENARLREALERYLTNNHNATTVSEGKHTEPGLCPACADNYANGMAALSGTAPAPKCGMCGGEADQVICLGCSESLCKASAPSVREEEQR